MTLGPLEFIVIGFEGNHFTGEILPEIRSLQERGIIHLLDLLVLKKDQQDQIEIVELSDLQDNGTSFVDLINDYSGLLSNEDIALIGRDMPTNSSAALALFEHTWAIELKDTIIRANGVLMASGLVKSEAAENAAAELAARGSAN